MKTSGIGYNRSHEVQDSVVVEKILSGEKELFEILMRRNNQKLYRVIKSYLRDEAEVEDIMQNTYLKSYEKLYQFNQKANFSTWLIRIGINEALARIKSKRKNQLLLNIDSPLFHNSIFHLSGSDNLNPEKKMIKQEAKQMFEKAIENLPSKYRVIYILGKVEEMPIAEISTCLNISVGNVKVRLHRAKTMLKESLYASASTADAFEFGFGRCDKMVNQVMKSILQ